jgi:hypothetical protein
MSAALSQIRRLNKRLGKQRACPNARPEGERVVVEVITHAPGEPEPVLPDVPPCPLCGGWHGELLLIEEIVVTGPDGKAGVPA